MSTSKDVFRKAVVFIYRNLDQPLSLERIATSVGVSTATLKRVFDEEIGKSPGALIRRLKMELAFRTLHSREESVLEVALATGFEDHSAFSRSFKRTFGFAPSAARQRINLQRELESVELEEPDLVELEPIAMQAVTAQGYYFECAPRAWAMLAERLRTVPAESLQACLYIGQALDDPHHGDSREDQVRFVGGVQGLTADLGLARQRIDGGRFARFRYHGKSANLGLAYHYIYGAWRERAAVGLRSQPAFVIFDELPTRDGDASIMICVPVDDG
jgi:AraC-like DNA-binding protein/DNA gyrase inhibitor GyrI